MLPARRRQGDRRFWKTGRKLSEIPCVGGKLPPAGPGGKTSGEDVRKTCGEGRSSDVRRPRGPGPAAARGGGAGREGGGSARHVSCPGRDGAPSGRQKRCSDPEFTPAAGHRRRGMAARLRDERRPPPRAGLHRPGPGQAERTGRRAAGRGDHGGGAGDRRRAPSRPSSALLRASTASATAAGAPRRRAAGYRPPAARGHGRGGSQRRAAASVTSTSSLHEQASTHDR